MDNTFYNLSENLEGRDIGRWHVNERISHKASTGGTFSHGYSVIDDAGNTGFLKALDYTKAFRDGASIDTFNAMTTAYIFERDLLNDCKTKKLRHVVTIIDHGRFELPEGEKPEGKNCLPVDYMVLEKADRSVRDIIDISQSFDIAWMLRSLHNVAVGVEELHGIQIAHQDIKPSNILVFDESNTSKLGDVGRSTSFRRHAAHDDLDHAGDWGYAPIELLYGKILPDWKLRRFSCDMYMFGNLIVTYFNNVSLTAAIYNMLPKRFTPSEWSGTYEEVLPTIELVFSQCLEHFNHNLPDSLRTDLLLLIKQLCEPDVLKRGDTSMSTIGSQQYSLRKYYTRLDVLARKYEYQLERMFV